MGRSTSCGHRSVLEIDLRLKTLPFTNVWISFDPVVVSKSYRTCDLDRPYLRPPSLQDWLPRNHLARFIAELTDGVDLSKIYGSYGRRDGRGKAAHHPAMMVAMCETLPDSAMLDADVEELLDLGCMASIQVLLAYARAHAGNVEVMEREWKTSAVRLSSIIRPGPLRSSDLAPRTFLVCPISTGIVPAAPTGVEPGDARRAARFRRNGRRGGRNTRPGAPSSSFLLPPLHRSPEPERFSSGFNYVSSIRDPIQQCLAQSRIGKHRRPFRKRQIRRDNQSRSLSPLRYHLK